MSRLAGLTIAFVAIAGAVPTPATAQQRPELVVWTTRAIATVLAEVGPEFERTAGVTLTITSDLPPAFRRRVIAGEPFDVLISGSVPVDESYDESGESRTLAVS